MAKFFERCEKMVKDVDLNVFAYMSYNGKFFF